MSNDEGWFRGWGAKIKLFPLILEANGFILVQRSHNLESNLRYLLDIPRAVGGNLD